MKPRLMSVSFQHGAQHADAELETPCPAADVDIRIDKQRFHRSRFSYAFVIPAEAGIQNEFILPWIPDLATRQAWQVGNDRHAQNCVINFSRWQGAFA